MSRHISPAQILHRTVSVEIPLKKVRTSGDSRAILHDFTATLFDPFRVFPSISKLQSEEAIAALAACISSADTLRDSGGEINKLLDEAGRKGRCPDVPTGRYSGAHIFVEPNGKTVLRGEPHQAAHVLRIHTATWTTISIFHAGESAVVVIDFGDWAHSRPDVDEDFVVSAQEKLDLLLQLERISGEQPTALIVRGTTVHLNVTSKLYDDVPEEEAAAA